MSPAAGYSGTASLRQWRVTTAVRVFSLALATGSVLAAGSFSQAAPLLAAIALIASATSALEWGTPTVGTRWLPVGESLLVAILLMSTPEQPGVLAYLAVPPAVAGVRFGLVTATNAIFVAAAASVVTAVVAGDPGGADRLARAALWLLAGYGVGLLATWQLRSVRDIEARQAPYAAANQLMSQLHQLARHGRVGLDSAQVASDLGVELRSATGAEQSAVFIDADGGAVDLLAAHGDTPQLLALRDQIADGKPAGPGVAQLPLRSADKVRGHVLLVRTKEWTDEPLARAQEIADEFVLRLDTAVLFDDVRLMATAEERNRIAREMHDGVAQEVVALGYVVDEIETVSQEPEIREMAANLRGEISRVVTELRFSIFDLRHHVADHRLAGALTEYVREISHGTGLRVHLILDESGPALPSRIETELLRIAQEALGNVRKHARAANVWITLVSDGSDVTLRIEDDGVGNAVPRERHWGLQTMTERAERIGARLTITPRADGGTVVLLRSTDVATPERITTRDHHRSPR
ncbi:sensor histidine kinase [Nocardioides sp.]|uniref:sensor histidine kinase n=1 Tax=Nocardioides sp. TaxID=35761 RepID=UPI002BFD833C|nr:sensor histidine kinase [Nocardioides sp.]HXH77982.1 sensor histidine kinase [Nocardioides sp.]